ncbi:MAG: SWIM zinc finger family protein [Dechloromonas sp.]|nr:SWIM zinc finger family protein [Candidatus Dechloromonas phosphoritropha]MBP8788244.1 SWIM zinc finger family protein [Azonexus sp.]
MTTDLLTPAILESLAGAAAFRRGEEYFSGGAVGPLRLTDDTISARVQGSEAYQVELRDDDGDLAWGCTCPRAADGYFCKHCVAVGLAWLAGDAAAPESGNASGKKKRRDPWRDIENFLGTQPQKALIELLLDVTRRDDRLYQSLLLKAERVVSGGNVAKAFRRAIDDASSINGYVDWREVRTFAGNLDQVADSLAELLQPDTAGMLVDLAEYAIERIEGALEQVDDSNGEIGGIASRLGEMHLRACTMAKPDAAALAERLFRLTTTLPFGICNFDAATYRDSLGKTGLQRYRELAEAEWRKIGPRCDDHGYDSHRATITRIMERLAEASGDVDELVAIKSRDLSSAYRYLGIAEILAKAGRKDEALEWAERGLRAFPDRPRDDLRDFLVAIYLERKRNDEALQLTWVQFEERPGLETFKKLNVVSGKLGMWPAQRERALARLADAIASEAAATSRWKPKPSPPDHSLRVAIALWEEDLDAAWTAAHQGVCDRNSLITLASKLESARPEDAISLYRRVVTPIVEQTNNAAYAEAIKLIRKVGGLMKTLNQSRQFGDYLAELRVRFKPKRNFIKLLDDIVRSTLSAK